MEPSGGAVAVDGGAGARMWAELERRAEEMAGRPAETRELLRSALTRGGTGPIRLGVCVFCDGGTVAWRGERGEAAAAAALGHWEDHCRAGPELAAYAPLLCGTCEPGALGREEAVFVSRRHLATHARAHHQRLAGSEAAAALRPHVHSPYKEALAKTFALTNAAKHSQVPGLEGLIADEVALLRQQHPDALPHAPLLPNNAQ